MRVQEAKMPRSKVEIRKQYINRLHKTAKALPKGLVNRIVGDMRRRVRLLYKAKGGFFEEGGRQVITFKK